MLPFDTGLFLRVVGLSERADEGVEKDIDGEGLSRVGKPRGGEVLDQGVDVETEQVMLRPKEFLVQNRVGMRTGFVVKRNVAV